MILFNNCFLSNLLTTADVPRVFVDGLKKTGTVC